MAGILADEHKRIIAGRARTLFERLDEPETLESGTQSSTEVTETFEALRDQFPDETSFERWLNENEVSRQDVRTAIRSDKLRSSEPLPKWIDQLDDVLETVLEADPEDFPTSFRADNCSSERETQIFGELSAAIAVYARNQLSVSVHDVLSERAIGSMMEWLQRRIGLRSARILYVEFKTFVAAHDYELALSDPSDYDELPTKYYNMFINYIFSGGLADICEEYPVFARKLVEQIDQWCEHLEEFSERLQSDRDRLADVFDVSGDLAKVKLLEPLADDTHGDGRAVMRVEFRCGLTVAYKPRSVEAGQAFSKLLANLNEHLSIPNLATPKYLTSDEYGWMEWLEHEGCSDESAVGRYYQRVGGLLCIAYFLELVDCQVENLIVAGEQPIIVDAETVLHPYISPDRRPAQTHLSTLQHDSVLLTLLLPYGIANTHRSAVSNILESIAGIGVTVEDQTIEDVEQPVIKAVNTDLMSVEVEPWTIERDENAPRVNTEPQLPEKYLDDIVHGFMKTYQTVVQLRDEGTLADEVGMPDLFEGVENRMVFRPTMEYMSVLQSLTSRECLRDGVRFGTEITGLAVPFCTEENCDRQPSGILNAERTALSRFDPPRFTSRTDGTTLRFNGETIDMEIDASGLERSQQRIQAADREDMLKQVELIRGCFGTVPDWNRDEGRDRTNEELLSEEEVTRQVVSEEQLRDEATALFDDLREVGFESTDGTYHWTSVASHDIGERFALKSVNASLYDGRCGIALFGAALHRVTGDETYREFTHQTLKPVCEAIRSKDKSLTALQTHGGGVGIGSIIYGLTVAGELLDDGTLLDRAAETVENTCPELTERDEMYDVIGGAAGTVLGLLALYDRRQNERFVSLATTYGDHLLENRFKSEHGFRVWRTLSDRPPLNGFGHGVSGIAYALCRLYSVTNNSKYREAALEALEYEAASFSEEETNWPDFRGDSQTYPNDWCYGRSGIGLSRLGMSKYVKSDIIEQGIERARNGLPCQGFDSIDDVCSGAAGQAEFLLELDRRLGQCSGEANAILGGMIARKQRTGSYRGVARTNRITIPSFFHGISGIGYTMLRATDPRLLPCVLLWK